MALITINNLHMGFRGPALFDGVNCRVEAGERIGLLGRNGSGKTTLMRLLVGEIEPDDGDVVLQPDARIAMLQQDVPTDLSGRIANVVAQGVMETADNEADWKSQNQVDQILSRMEMDGELNFETLSAGMKRRVLLAQQLVANPDLLLLDEPTNHLDITAITWLEDFLQKWPRTFLFVTHDRTFLRKLATRILEIDRGHLFDWSCDYDTFLVRKEAALEVEEKQNALFDKKLAQEEAWIRQGIKARRTRNEGRVRALEKLRLQHRERRAKSATAKITIDEGQRSGQLVVQVNEVSFAYKDSVIVDLFSTMIMRGDKVGVVGPNGAGKTTLLRILLGELTPQSGTVRLGTNLDIAYFDQQRDKLNEDQSVEENVGDGYQSVKVGGRSKHIIGYLQDFLFSPERARTAIRFLSGGERNRVLLAKLFAKPANVLVLDEPTNDLDTETLELLEQRLVEYEGTVLLVSHDRTFLNNVVTSTIAFEDGHVREYPGGYDDWLRQRSESVAVQRSNNAKKPKRKQQPEKGQRKGLTYKEKQELVALPETIERLESEIATLHEAMARPEFYQKPGGEIAAEQSKLTKLENDLAVAYTRWEELEQQGL